MKIEKWNIVVTFIYVTILVFSFISVLCGGLIIGICCECTSTAGGLRLDFSPIYSFFGLVLLILGLLGLMKTIKKKKKILLKGIVIYGICLGVFCIYINLSSASRLTEMYYHEIGILPPIGLNVIIALVSVFGLVLYPFYKYERERNEKKFKNLLLQK